MMNIGSFDINKKVMIIAEIGNNHEGDVDLAKRMIELAAKSGADAVKFQTFQTQYFVSAADPARFKRLQSFELRFDEFRSLSRTAADEGVIFLSTPFDLESAEFLNDIVPAFKIASGDNNFYPLLEKVASFGKPVLLSRGLADFDAVRRAVTLLEDTSKARGIAAHLAILHCVTGYPVAPREANLLAIRELQTEFPYPIGYSDHVIGLEAAAAAVALGARIVEKHFTVDKNFSNFRDHAISADPADLVRLVERIRTLEEMLGCGTSQIQDSEKTMMPLVRRSVVAKKDLAQGSVLAMGDFTWIRPGHGLNPGQEKTLVGKKLRRTVRFGEPITLDMVE